MWGEKELKNVQQNAACLVIVGVVSVNDFKFDTVAPILNKIAIVAISRSKPNLKVLVLYL